MSQLPASLALIVVLGAYTCPGRAQEEPDARIRREVQVEYGRIADAVRSRDLAAILAVQDSTFTSLNPNGQAFDYAAMAEYSRRLTSVVDSVLHISNTIRTFEVRGAARDTAIADVCQEFVRLQRFGAEQRLVETSALQTETWVRRAAGWRRARVENVRGTRWFVAGKRVDATRPYDPDAPPYAPAVDPPTGCGRR